MSNSTPVTIRTVVARTAAIATIALIALVAAGPTLTPWRPAGQANAAATADTDNPVKGITVQGSGKVTLSPDLATISIGVQAQGASAAKAESGASAAMARIIAAVKSKGVADADIATQWVSLDAQYDYNAGSTPPRVIGYMGNQSLSVKVRKIENTGEVIDAAVGAGATQIGGVSFSVTDPAGASAQARSAAIADAVARARSLAGAAGVTLGSAISISEVSAPVTTPYPYAYDKASVGAPLAPTPVQPGTTEVEVDVQVTFAIG